MIYCSPLVFLIVFLTLACRIANRTPSALKQVFLSVMYSLPA